MPLDLLSEFLRSPNHTLFGSRCLYTFVFPFLLRSPSLPPLPFFLRGPTQLDVSGRLYRCLARGAGPPGLRQPGGHRVRLLGADTDCVAYQSANAPWARTLRAAFFRGRCASLPSRLPPLLSLFLPFAFAAATAPCFSGLWPGLRCGLGWWSRLGLAAYLRLGLGAIAFSTYSLAAHCFLLKRKAAAARAAATTRQQRR